MTLKVSVVVPVYNPGEHIDALIESLLGQSLPEDEYEVIFADDESTDGTAERLDALADELAFVQVVHNSPNSGWPGRPRNLGMDIARGEYVYFVDSDDWLEPQALERMYDYGTENDSDIVWGRVVGENRYVPRAIFRRNVPDAVLGEDPIIALLTVHKMFRTSMIRSAGLRFPEGRKRLEDHHFVVPAYFAANRISVLSDYPCYHWRRLDDAGNISAGMGDPTEYFTSVREVLDIVDANTEPGEFRDSLISHWYGGKTLRWFEGNHMAHYSPEYRQELFDIVRALVDERFGPAVDRYLLPRRRFTSELVRRGDLDGLTALMGWLGGIRVAATADPVRWVDDTLQVGLACRLEDSTGRVLTIRRHGERELFQLPPELGVELSPDALDVTGEAERAFIDGYLRNRSTAVAEILPSVLLARPEFGDDGVAELRAFSQITIDPRTSVLAAPTGTHDVLARFHCAGWSLDARPAVGQQPVVDGLPHEFDKMLVTAYGTENYGNLSLRRARIAPPPPPPKPPPAPKPPPPPPPTTRVRVVRRLRRIARRLRPGRSGRSTSRAQ